MSNYNKSIFILGGARDFHAIDWYRAVLRVSPDREAIFVTDLFGGEGYTNLTKQGDIIYPLIIIDKFLFSGQSTYSNLWRNFIKLILLPIQAARLRNILIKFPNRIVHAHPIYYMVMCLLAGIDYVGTPQGDEILIRPHRSRIYKYFAAKALRGAKAVIVDSIQMKDGVKAMANIDAHVFQNGINVDQISQFNKSNNRDQIVSIRGMEDLYRIKEIVEVRNKTAEFIHLSFAYPFSDTIYLSHLRYLLKPLDVDFGRLKKEDLYELLSDSFLVISIPRSDSSPRSVYESIFAGACVAVTYNSWIDVLPQCMKSRIFVVDLADCQWLNKAISFARTTVETKFIASEEAIEIYSENRSIKKVIEKFY